MTRIDLRATSSHRGGQAASDADEDQDVILTHIGPVPSLFRQTLISNGKQCEPTSSEIAGRAAYPHVRQPPSEVRDVLRRGNCTGRLQARGAVCATVSTERK